MMDISIAKDYSETPGARYEKEGPDSGEKFREEILLPKYKEAKEKGDKLCIDFDGCYGFATSFLEESFGGLVRKIKEKGCLERMQLISNDDESIIGLVEKYVKEAEDRL